jgi:hypothetical protein
VHFGQTFEIHAFGSCIRFSSGDAESYSIIDRFVFPSFPRVAASGKEVDLEISLDRVEDKFRLTADGILCSSSISESETAANLIHVIDEKVVERLSTLRAVHAGVVTWRGQGMLFPGQSHAGKSTLVAAFLQRGATYFSDEYALIDPEGRVNPYPRSLLLRNGGAEQRPISASDHDAQTGLEPAPIRWIFSLQFDPEATLKITEVGQSLGMVLLLSNTPHWLERSPELMSTFQRAVSGARCFAGNRHTAEEAVDHILRLVDAAS